jgi:Family of unknown function (DUF6353)
MKLIPTTITQTVGRQLLQTQKHSPRILFAVGLAGVVTSTVLACRSTLKLGETLDNFKQDIDDTKVLAHSQVLTPEMHRPDGKDLAYVYVKGTYSLVKLYAPAILIGTASIAALTTSHTTLMRRNASLTAAYSALQVSFDAYRERVKAELGTERELMLRHNAHVETVEIEGKKQEVMVADPNGWSPYARFFDEGSTEWVKNAEMNRIFLQCQQNYFNHILHARGHVFLNEVYDHLGLMRSKEGSVVGWVMGNGDNFIDFGLFDAASSRFINGYERSILLDFNVDGVIYDKI